MFQVLNMFNPGDSSELRGHDDVIVENDDT